MFQVSVIGHLGADAEVKSANGKPFVSFNVAHTDKWTGEDGVVHEDTLWVSCALNGDGGKLLPYLKRGACVFVQGRASLRVFSSKKARAMVAGCNLSVDRIELVGGAVDDVPREVIAEDGRVFRTFRAYYVNADELKDIIPRKGEVTLMHDARGGDYNLDEYGYVWPLKQPQDDVQETQS